MATIEKKVDSAIVSVEYDKHHFEAKVKALQVLLESIYQLTSQIENDAARLDSDVQIIINSQKEQN